MREFITDDSNFSTCTSGRVLSSFLKNCPVYTDGNDEILSDLPLLTKYFPPNNEEYQNSIDKDIFAALYSPPSECRGKTNKSSPVTQKRRGQSFKVHVAYQGEDFCGWQIQPDNDVPSIQQTLIDTLDPLLNAEIQKPIDIRVCGRTDAGVSAIGQVCRVRTIRKDVKELEIQQCINTSSFGSKSLSPSLGCVKVEEVSEKFHPTFDATQRGYRYRTIGIACERHLWKRYLGESNLHIYEFFTENNRRRRIRLSCTIVWKGQDPVYIMHAS